MSNNSVAIFHSNDLMPKNADQVMKFKQNSDLFHLSGIDQEETVLVLVKNTEGVEEILFIKETNEAIKIWEGEKLTKTEAQQKSKITTVFWNTEFKKEISNTGSSSSIIYLNSNDHPRANIVVESRDARFKRWIQNKFPKKVYKKSSDILYEIRAIKQKPEIQLIQKACDITALGVKRVLKNLRPGIHEYEIEAEIIHEFLINKSSESIITTYDPDAFNIDSLNA